MLFFVFYTSQNCYCSTNVVMVRNGDNPKMNQLRVGDEMCFYGIYDADIVTFFSLPSSDRTTL